MLVAKVLLPLAVASFVVGSLSFAYAQASNTDTGTDPSVVSAASSTASPGATLPSGGRPPRADRN